MQCTDSCLSSQAVYLQKLTLCNISYEIGKKCDDHEHILVQVAGFTSLFASKSVGHTTPHSIGNMPYTLARYLQNQINVESVLKDISAVEHKYETEFMYVALSVCFANALKLGGDSQTGKARLTTKTGVLSEDVDASADYFIMLHDYPNLQTWLKNLHERAQKDEAIIKKFISTQIQSHANSLFQIKALGYIMISSGCSSTLPADFVAVIMGESLLRDKILNFFAAETQARELYDQNLKNNTASYGKHPFINMLVPDYTSLIPIGMPVDDGRPVNIALPDFG
jgi:hypothetical protein